MWIVFAVIAALITTAAALVAPTITFVGLIGLCALLVIRDRWYVLAPLSLFLAATTLPTFVPNALGFAGFSFRTYEPVLVLAFMWALTKRELIGRETRRCIYMLSGFVLVGCLVAVAEAAAPVRIIGDARYIAEAVMAVIVAAVVVADGPSRKATVSTLRVSLWISMVFTILAAAGIVAIEGRSEAAELDMSEAADSATRILGAATFFALATVCVCFALSVLGQASLRVTWSWWVPAIMVLFLAFSRNHLVAVAVTLLIAFLAVRSLHRMVKAVFVGLVIALGLGALTLVSPSLSDLPGGAWVNVQINSYTSRVLDGFDSTVTSKDSSTVYRENEIVALRKASSDAPILGHGFGFAYQKPQGPKGTFFFERAPYYSHNLYWWAAAKTGIVGLVLLLGASVLPLLLGLRRNADPRGTAFAATLGGLLVVCWVAPLPLAAPSSVVFGAVLGAAVALSSSRPVTKDSFDESARAVQV